MSEATDSALELLEAQVKSCLNQIETEPQSNSRVNKERGESFVDGIEATEENARVDLMILSDDNEAENSESSNTRSLCRLCASQSEDLIHMFGTNCEPYRNIIQKIEDCLPIMVR